MLPYQGESRANRLARRIADAGQAGEETTRRCRMRPETEVDRRTPLGTRSRVSSAIHARPAASGVDRFFPIVSVLFRPGPGF